MNPKLNREPAEAVEDKGWCDPSSGGVEEVSTRGIGSSGCVGSLWRCWKFMEEVNPQGGRRRSPVPSRVPADSSRKKDMSFMSSDSWMWS